MDLLYYGRETKSIKYLKWEVNMEFDAKQKVLVSIYAEYQKDLPDMEKNIKAEIIGLDYKTFLIALDKLENERLITGTRFATTLQGPQAAFLHNTKMTPYGLQYVETELNIQPEKTGKEKIQELATKTISWGWNEAKDIIARIASELIQNAN